MKPIPLIDIFAGPGGLSEGFSALRITRRPVFSVKLSVEKDECAHRTLELRSFYRQFTPGKIPDDYYKHIRGNISRDQLYDKYPREAAMAKEEAWHAELGGNLFPDREIDERINKALGEEKDRWVLIGGPPCQAYSLVGRARIRGASKEKYEEDARHHLYLQYLRILAIHKPPVFVMENVKGLLSARVKEEKIVESIVRDLAEPARDIPATPLQHKQHLPTYRLFSLTHPGEDVKKLKPEDFIVRCEQYGIPQARHRMIILGIREDVNTKPRALTPYPDGPVTIDQVIGDLPPLRSGLSKEEDNEANWYKAIRRAAGASWIGKGRLDKDVYSALHTTLKVLSPELKRGGEFLKGRPNPAVHHQWFYDSSLKGFCNHATRSHIREDLYRYLFAAVYGDVHKRSPRLENFPQELLPRHSNVQEALAKGKFNDRFRVQIAGRPSTTVTSHISKDGHYFIHPDPTQCRSLTVREAARLQTFPDNYFFEGPRTEQYRQVGNAVPPLMAKQIAEIVSSLFT